jgi:hypothetical protein
MTEQKRQHPERIFLKNDRNEGRLAEAGCERDFGPNGSARDIRVSETGRNDPPAADSRAIR